jgi:hypothetical protein
MVRAILFILSKKDLPVFLTEVGYGMLGKSARDTKEGRLRQWRWFKSVGEQIATLRPEAPMAFYLRPYLEYDTSEYGLTVPAKPGSGKQGRMGARKQILMTPAICRVESNIHRKTLARKRPSHG